jgi:hypothetical protein
VIEALKRLHGAGYELDPAELSDWALAKHWSPDAAEQLKQYAEKLNQGKVLRRPSGVTSERLRPDVVEQWREEADRLNAE